MKILVVRHGFAGDETDKEDPDRKLTPEGREDVRALAVWLEKYNEIPSCIYSGPRVRCVETAKILQTELGLPKVELEDGLGPGKGNSLAQVVKRLASNRRLKRIAIVSNHDAIDEGLRALDLIEHEIQFDRIAMAELRILDVKRKSGKWEEKLRVMPSDLGGEDRY